MEAAPAPPPPRALPPLEIESEDDWRALVVEDAAAREAAFEAFRAETDGTRLDFLQSVLAEHAPLRNDPAWQDRFMRIAEEDPWPARRAAALLFLQQAETIRAVHARLLALAEYGSEVRRHALAALAGLPDRRLPDPELRALARRLADGDPDPAVRAMAVRLAADPERAARALADPHPEVRRQAALVAPVEALAAALERETDARAREAMEQRTR